ncbi:hypothetical protein ACLKA7_004694 [Drosophila subpalustris]
MPTTTTGTDKSDILTNFFQGAWGRGRREECRVLKAHCGFSSPMANLSYNSNFSTPSKSSTTTSSSWLLSKV